MSETIILIRVQSSTCELDFCESGHYDDFPKVANFVAAVLNLEINDQIDGPSERNWGFKKSSLRLFNDPYGTTLKANSWVDLCSLKKVVSQYLKNKITVSQTSGSK